MVLGTNTHLLYVLQTEPAVTIFDWSLWHQLMKHLNPQQRHALVEAFEGRLAWGTTREAGEGEEGCLPGFFSRPGAGGPPGKHACHT